IGRGAVTPAATPGEQADGSRATPPKRQCANWVRAVIDDGRIDRCRAVAPRLLISGWTIEKGSHRTARFPFLRADARAVLVDPLRANSGRRWAPELSAAPDPACPNFERCRGPV